MTVAVKETSQTDSPSPFDRLAVRSLVGMVYVLGGIGVVFYGVPRLWDALVAPSTRLLGSFVDVALLLVVMAGVAAGLIWLGARLTGPQPPHGLRAGVFIAIVGALAIAWLTWLVGGILENVGLHGPNAWIGATLTGLVGLALAALGLRWLFRERTESFLVTLEDQGWFTAAPYKKSQGQRVRRGTILGILILAGAGIYTMISHDTLATAGYEHWALTLPFTPGTVTAAGDSGLEVGSRVDRFELEAVNAQLSSLRKVSEPGDATFARGQLVTLAEFDQERDRLMKADGLRPPVAVPATPAAAAFPQVVLLPHVRFTVPLLLFAAALWLAYRVVNFPVFADFLIATEAEMNKVSWTTRKRLVQDTIVVLVMVIILTVYLFLVDIMWGQSLEWIQVLQFNQGEAKQTEKIEQVDY